MNELSFRARLTAFFVAIVVLPMIAVAVLAVRVTEDSRNARADATLDASLEAATALYEDSLAGVPGDAARIADSPGVTAALADGDAGFLRRVARRELRDPDIVLLTFYSADGNELASAGNPDGLAASREPFDRGGEPAGEILLAALDPVEFADELAELTGDDVLIASGGRELAATTETAAAGPAVGAEGGAVDLGDEERRAAGTSLAGAPPGTWLVLITEHADAFVASAPLAAVALLAFFALALLLVWFALRVLRGQVGSMLDAARRIGAGDLSGRVPVQGDDEIAGLAREFNKMSDRLSAQMGELQHQREEIDESVRRIGEAFASGLDRPATLEIVVETALTACEAERGRIVLSGEDGLVVSVGEAPEAGDGSLDVAIRLAIAAARDARNPTEQTSGPARAIAYPLVHSSDPGERVGTMAVARLGPAFSASEREVLRYLIGQAAVSIENIGLHERVAAQAATDELTGLSNSRHFREWMRREALRLSRFGGELALVMLDIDDFKSVNDTYGHLQGNAVLAAVGRTLKLESRGVDEPARYGGDEFVLALPETPREGALEVADRVRERIAETTVPGVDGGPTVAVTVSVGVATMPADAGGIEALIATADAALYEAKRGGKNRLGRPQGL